MSKEKRSSYSLFTEKYRGESIGSIILPRPLKTFFNKLVKEGEIPNLILYSDDPGMGKSTTAKALIAEIGCDNLQINASLENGIDVLRDKIISFASCASFDSDKKKIVLLDECQNISEAFQLALRGVLEEFHNICRFIMTTNSISPIQKPILDRFHTIDFGASFYNDKEELRPKIKKRLELILKNEKIQYDPDVIDELILKHYPSIRKMLNIIQNYSKTSTIIDSGILKKTEDLSDVFIDAMFKFNVTKVREIIITSCQNYDDFYSMLYRKFIPKLEKQQIPPSIITVAEYAYKSQQCNDKEIQLIACIYELISQLQ